MSPIWCAVMYALVVGTAARVVERVVITNITNEPDLAIFKRDSIPESISESISNLNIPSESGPQGGIFKRDSTSSNVHDYDLSFNLVNQALASV